MRSAARNSDASSSIPSFLSSGSDEYGNREPNCARDARAVEFFDCRDTIQHEQLRSFDVIWSKCGVRGSARQRNLAAGPIDDVAVSVIPFDDAANVPDIVRQAGDDEVGI